MGIKLPRWGEKSQSNLNLIGTNEINMHLNETNIVNQFGEQIKFWWVVPGEMLYGGVVKLTLIKGRDNKPGSSVILRLSAHSVERRNGFYFGKLIVT